VSRSLWFGTSISLLLLVSTGSALAADAPEGETLPTPRPLMVPAPPPQLVFQRPNRYAVWQYYAVDGRGHFVPLVVDSPVGPVYLYNGAPAPWVTVNPRSYARIYIGQ
jgi:hypothetical protein